jgi:hypothetical protein
LRGSQRLAFTPLGASVAPRRTRGLRPRCWSTQLLPWTNVPQSACKRIELSPSCFAALAGEYPANHANLPASTGFFASRRSPVRSRLAPLRRVAGNLHLLPSAQGSYGLRQRIGHQLWSSNRRTRSSRRGSRPLGCGLKDGALDLVRDAVRGRRPISRLDLGESDRPPPREWRPIRASTPSPTRFVRSASSCRSKQSCAEAQAGDCRAKRGRPTPRL